MKNQKQHQKVRSIVIGNSEKQKRKHANDYFEFVIKSFFIIFQFSHYAGLLDSQFWQLSLCFTVCFFIRHR